MMEYEAVKDLAAELITTQFSTFFSPRQLSHEILAKKYGIPLKRIFHHMEEFRDEHHSLIRQLNYVLRDLAEKGVIIKFNRNFWRKQNGVIKNREKEVE